MNPSVNKLIDSAIDVVRTMQSAGGRLTSLLPWSAHAATDLPNEMILFVKPEVTYPDRPVRIREVIDLLLDGFEPFGIEIAALVVLGAAYLRDHELVAQHYGVINEVSRLGIDALSVEAAAKARALRAGDEPILGGHQVLDRYSTLTPASLGALWDKGQGARLASGTYGQRVRIGSNDVIVLNGFHPAQITHFTEAGRSIVVMGVRSRSSWRALRQDYLGVTDPAKASPGSFRRRLLENRERLGMPKVDQGLNGAHLSAGPLEGLAEIRRYFTDFDQNKPMTIPQTAFGNALLQAGFDNATIERLLGNPRLVTPTGTPQSAFDMTEETDWQQAVEALRAATQGATPSAR